MDITSLEGEVNSLAARLLEPFDDNDISQIDGLNYVDPTRYKYRLLVAFKEGFEFHVTGTRYIEALGGFLAEARFHGSDDGVTYDIIVPVFKELQRGSAQSERAGLAIRIEETVNQLTSRGVKAVADKMGLGLHIYFVPAKHTGTNGKTTSSAAPTTATGDDVIGYGKHKGTKYSDLDNDYLEFIAGPKMKQPDAKAKAEIERRKGTATVAPLDGADEEVPF